MPNERTLFTSKSQRKYAPTIMKMIQFALIAITIFLAANAQVNTGKAKLTSELISKSSRANAPDFTLSDINGKQITLLQYKGQVVLLDFWATTCGGCKVELPWYVDFDKRYHSQGLAVIGLDMYGETPEVIKPFMAKWNMNYPVAVGTDALGERFGLKDMPLTLLIDRDGKIAVSHAGIVNKDVFEKDLKQLL